MLVVKTASFILSFFCRYLSLGPHVVKVGQGDEKDEDDEGEGD